MDVQAIRQSLDFLHRHGMHSDCVDLESSLAAFRRQMTAGLCAQPSSLMMIPAYIGKTAQSAGRRVLALDAGGTNFRVAVVAFDEAGEPVVEYMDKRPMPGSQGKLQLEGFFSAVVDAMLPVAEQSDTVGLCFSFPAVILPNREGRILCFNKEIQIEGAQGALLGEGINAELRRRGQGPKRFTVLNDTVATLLCGMSGDVRRYDGHIGYILGTGTNTAYMEHVSAIEKLGGADGEMIINMESGGYDGFSQGTFDKQLDAASETPGDHKMEKMISGAYQGDLIYRTVCGAADEGLFSTDFSRKLDRLDTFTMEQISEYCKKARRGALAELGAGNERDETVLRTIVDDSFERSARITAVNFAAIVCKTGRGKDPNQPVCVMAEGTTFFKSPLFRPKLDRYIQEWIHGALGHYCVIRKAENATILGSAIAAL